jgi:hypothetical protein
MYRQGDVLLIPVDPAELPDHSMPVDRDEHGRLILVYGEETGHAHVITTPNAELLTDADEVDRRFLILAAEAPLVHEEHLAISLPVGTYRVVRQREYSLATSREAID